MLYAISRPCCVISGGQSGKARVKKAMLAFGLFIAIRGEQLPRLPQSSTHRQAWDTSKARIRPLVVMDTRIETLQFECDVWRYNYSIAWPAISYWWPKPFLATDFDQAETSTIKKISLATRSSRSPIARSCVGWLNAFRRVSRCFNALAVCNQGGILGGFQTISSDQNTNIA